MIQDDNFLDKDKVWDVERLMLGKNFPWYYSDRIVDADYYEKFNVTNVSKYNGFQFGHVFYSAGKPESDYYELALTIFHTFCQKNGVDYRAILRAKANLTTQDSAATGIMPHVDHPFDHNVFLYYVNDSDGDTILYKDKFVVGGDAVEIEEDCRISPVAGRAILFDGRSYHSPDIPQKSRSRVVINMTFI